MSTFWTKYSLLSSEVISHVLNYKSTQWFMNFSTISFFEIYARLPFVQFSHNFSIFFFEEDIYMEV